ncbi:FtsX-like permease family protein [Streptomyces sp. 4N509B]|uniref:FtsX-like permease family protein n=1 Tax=Streptomyces sp. 4N509B TaxID=3457413 RepID=UPI003FD60CB2
MSRGERSPRTWARDLALGVRFAVSGGPSGWARTVLTTLGVGLGVVVLLTAAAVPNLLSAQDARQLAREPGCLSDISSMGAGGSCYDAEPRSDTLLYTWRYTDFHEKNIIGAMLQPDAGAETTAEPPPGVEAFPGPGEMVVSPALGRLLESEDGALLAERLDYEIVGTIGEEGLTGSGELYFYAGSDTLVVSDTDEAGASGEAAIRVDSFGGRASDTPMAAALLLLLAVICVVLLMPVAVFIATAVRFGGERRDRRLAALRLVGADAASTRRIAAGETLVGALGGVLLGLLALLPLRQYLGSVTVFGFSAFPGDFVPNASLTALVVLGVPVTSVVVTLTALRRVAIEPLGVVRQAVPRRRRLLWRLVPGLLGLALLLPLASSFDSNSDLSVAQAVAGMILLLAGVTLLLPWLVERLIGGLRRGPVSWQLAVRRVQLSAGSAARPVSGIVVAVAGATALYMLFAGVRAEETTETGRDPDVFQAELSAYELSDEERSTLGTEVAAQPGVTTMLPMEAGWATTAGTNSEVSFEVVIAECDTLRQLASIGSCADGDTFVVPEPSLDPIRPGDEINLGSDTTGEAAGEEKRWTLPANAREVAPRENTTTGYSMASGIFTTPSVLSSDDLGDPVTRLLLRFDPSEPDALEHVRNVAWPYGDRAGVWQVTSDSVSDEFADIQTGLLIGATGVMMLIGASMIVTMVEQLRERKRLLSVLVAFGTRRTTLAASVLWQTALPVVLGLALAAAVGTALGAVLMEMVNLSVTDWLAFLPMAGVGVGVIAVVTMASLPFLWHLMRPDGLRTE